MWVKEPVWKKLVEWYGGGPEFPRSSGFLEGAFDASIDMYPQPCRVRAGWRFWRVSTSPPFGSPSTLP